MRRAAMYVRVSTAEQAAAGESLAVQRRRCTEHCEHEGYTVVGHYQDVMSGRRADRPAYLELREACREHRFDVVVVQYLDRLGRNLREATRCWDELEDLGITLEATDQPIPSGPEGKMVRYLMGWLAERESERIGERVRGAVLQKLGRGEHWARAPYGWHVEAGRLVVYEPEAVVVREAVRLAAGGAGYIAIAAALNARGWERRPAARTRSLAWTPSAVGKLLRRDGNDGAATWGKAGRPKNKEGKKTALGHATPALVPAAQQAAAKRGAQLRTANRGLRAGGSPFLLAGLIYCGACGHRMVGSMSRSTRAKQYTYYYTCRGNRDHAPDGCTVTRYTNAARLHEDLLARLGALADVELAATLVPPPVAAVDALAAEADALRAELGRVTAELRRQYDLYSRGVLDEAALAEVGRTYASRREGAERRLLTIAAEQETAAASRARLTALPTLVRSFAATAADLPAATRKAGLAELVARVVVGGDGDVAVTFRL